MWFGSLFCLKFLVFPFSGFLAYNSSTKHNSLRTEMWLFVLRCTFSKSFCLLITMDPQFQVSPLSYIRVPKSNSKGPNINQATISVKSHRE